LIRTLKPIQGLFGKFIFEIDCAVGVPCLGICLGVWHRNTEPGCIESCLNGVSSKDVEKYLDMALRL